MIRDGDRSSSSYGLEAADRGLGDGSFGIMPFVVMLDRDLSASALRLYMLIRSYTYKGRTSWPGQRRLGLEMGVTTRTIKSLVAELRGRGLIKVLKPSSARATNTYKLAHMDEVYPEEWIEWCSKHRSVEELTERFGVTGDADEDREPRGDTDAHPGEETFTRVGQKASHPPTTLGMRSSPEVDEDDGEEDEVNRAAVAAHLNHDSYFGRSSGSVSVVRSDPVPAASASSADARDRNGGIRTAPFAKNMTGASIISKEADVSIVDAPPCWPPQSSTDLFSVWATEMLRHDADFVPPKSAVRIDLNAAAELLRTYDPAFYDGLLLAMIRLAIWDWPAIQVTVDPYYTSKQQHPSLKVIRKIATVLAASVESGITSSASMTSSYRARWHPKAMPKTEAPKPDAIAPIEREAMPSPAQNKSGSTVTNTTAKSKDEMPERLDGAQKVHDVWVAEMQHYNPDFVASSKISSLDRDVANKLLALYHQDATDDLLVRMIRVAIWDWPAIQASVETWYTSKKKFPTLPVIFKLATTLAGSTKTGIIAPPSHRSSQYQLKWFPVVRDPSVALSDDGPVRVAEREGKTEGQVMRERMARRIEEQRRREAMEEEAREARRGVVG